MYFFINLYISMKNIMTSRLYHWHFGCIILPWMSATLSFCLLGILTKPDLVDKGAEEGVVDVVRNLVIHLKKGYMIVRCRGQQEITDRVTLTEATEREKAFFHDHAHFELVTYFSVILTPFFHGKLFVLGFALHIHCTQWLFLLAQALSTIMAMLVFLNWRRNSHLS